MYDIAGTAVAETKNEEAAKNNFAKAKIYLETAIKEDPRLDAAYLIWASRTINLVNFSSPSMF